MQGLENQFSATHCIKISSWPTKTEAKPEKISNNAKLISGQNPFGRKHMFRNKMMNYEHIICVYILLTSSC